MNLLLNKKSQPLLWGLLHGANDMTAGYLLAGFALTHEKNESFLMVTLYAILGFGGQLPVAFWLDKRKHISFFARVSVSLIPLSILIYFFSHEAAIICAGFSSAFVHVTGGTVCLQLNENKSGPLSLFTAPGILGLSFGSVLGNTGQFLPALLLLFSVVIGFFIMKSGLPGYKSVSEKKSGMEKHDFIMLLILLFMCFRSFLFDVVNYAGGNFEEGIFYIGISAFAGKLIGGFVSDLIGERKFIYISLIAALLLFQFGKDNLNALCAGIVFLQSSVPVTLVMMGRCLPAFPATASAFSLGISLVIAGLPLFLVADKKITYTFFINPWVIGGLLLFILAVWIGGRKLSVL